MIGAYSSPEVRCIVGANVQAFRWPLVAPPPNGFNGGVVLDSTDADLRLRQSRYWEVVDHFDSSARFDALLPEECIYLGPVYDHFGHMMAEMVHRAIPALKLFRERKFVLVSTLDNQNITSPSSIPRFVKHWLRFLEISLDNIVVITQDTTVSSLSICEQGSDFGGGPKVGYLEYLNAFSTPRLDWLFKDKKPFTKKIYVSRKNIRYGGIFIGESYIEELLKLEGYEIFIPEEWSIVYQMHTYRSAEFLIFAEGAACHGVEMLGESTLHTCCIIERRPDHREIFRLVLEPRAKRFLRFDQTLSVGSVVVEKSTGAPIPNLGVAVIAIDGFAAFLREQGMANLFSIDKNRYTEHLRRDLELYIEYHKTSGFMIESEENIRRLRVNLESIVKRL